MATNINIPSNNIPLGKKVPLVNKACNSMGDQTAVQIKKIPSFKTNFLFCEMQINFKRRKSKVSTCFYFYQEKKVLLKMTEQKLERSKE